MKTAATGTMIAGIKVPRLFDEDDLAAVVDVSEEAGDVFAAEVGASLLATVAEAWNADSCALSVIKIVWSLVVIKVEAGCATVSWNGRIIVVKAEPPSAMILVGAGPSTLNGAVMLP